MMKKFILLTVVIGSLTGCQDTVNTVSNRQTTGRPQTVDVSKISTDAFLRRRLKIVSVNKVIKPDGLMVVQVTARNVRTGIMSQLSSWFMSDNPYKIAYRFHWFDRNGMEVKTAAGTWVPLTVIPGDTIRLQAVSPNPSCRDFTLSLREN